MGLCPDKAWVVLHVLLSIFTVVILIVVIILTFTGFIEVSVDINGTETNLFQLAFPGYTAYTTGMHTFTGMIMLLIGPFQVWAWFRHKFLEVHRWMGRTYVFFECLCLITIMASYPGAILNQIQNGENPMSPVNGRFLLDAGCLWLFELATLTYAFWRIRFHKDFFWHRIGMFYNFAGMLCVPEWWTWATIARFAGYPYDNEAQPNIFELMFANSLIVTIILLIELHEDRDKRKKGVKKGDDEVNMMQSPRTDETVAGGGKSADHY